MMELLVENFKEGDTVRYLGCTKEQIEWGNNDRPYMLILDRFYTVEKVEVHSYHTKLTLKGICGRFNSVCFEKILD